MAFKYSVSNWIYGDEDIKSVFSRLQRCGYDGIEIEGEPTKYDVNEIKALSKAFEIKVMSVVGMFTAERDLSSPDPSIRTNAVKYVKDLVDFAGELGAKVVIIIPSAIGRIRPYNVGPSNVNEWDKEFDKEWEYAVESIKDAGLYAQKKGIILAIEPINRYETLLVHTAEEGLKMMRQVNLHSVKLHLDTFHMNIEETNPLYSIWQADKSLVNFHVADSNRQAVGKGHINWVCILKALCDIGYTGALTFEALPPVADLFLAPYIKKYQPMRDEDACISIQKLKAIEKRICPKKYKFRIQGDGSKPLKKSLT